MKKLLNICLLSFTCIILTCFAKEPFNLAYLKKELIRYHDSGDYERDIDVVIQNAIQYLQLRLQHPSFQNLKKPAIVVDVDETALSSYPLMLSLDFGMLKNKFQEYENQTNAVLIPPTLKLYQFAKQHQIAVFFITGRPEYQRDITAKNLEKAGYTNWDGLIFKHNDFKNKPDWIFKSSMRQQVVAQGYHVLLNIGDQESDLAGGYADKTFKLPNPFYIIPKAY